MTQDTEGRTDPFLGRPSFKRPGFSPCFFGQSGTSKPIKFCSCVDTVIVLGIRCPEENCPPALEDCYDK